MGPSEIYQLMTDLKVQLERITAFEAPITKPDLEDYTKGLKAPPPIRLDSAKVAQMLLPLLIAQLPGQLPMKVSVPSEKIVELLAPLINQQVTAIQTTNERVLREMSRYLTALEATLAKGQQASRESEARLEAIVTRIPKKVPVDFLQGWRVVLGMSLGPLVVAMLVLASAGVFRKEPVESFNLVVRRYGELRTLNITLHEQNARQQQRQSELEKERNAYRTEAESYRKKFPRAGVPKAKYPVSKGK